MRIKRIEIIGFKSFCDRAVLNINTPITSIVGPNGCGKSNIVDAIRWCMGEQSAKHLRGKAMDDVIFAGSDNRGPASMAEVSLTFDDVGFSHEAMELRLRQAAESAASANDETSAVATSEGTEPDAIEAGATSTSLTEADGAATPEADSAATPEADSAATPEADSAATTEADSDDDETRVTGERSSSVDENAPDAAAVLVADAEPDADRTAVDEPTEPSVLEGDEPTEPSVSESTEPSVSEQVEAFLEDKPPAFDFARYSEVTVTRRLFRDGTSQYMINKTPCRLRDVTDFFLGTGTGTKAYSIIEQGRIGMIVSARPQERRALIEEAAGITKFKSKKKAATRKLEQTRQNLLRVSDIVAELEKRMNSLRRQAQKAKRYRRYKAEIRDIELWKGAHRYLDLCARQKVLDATLTSSVERLEDARVSHEAQEAKLLADRAELSVEERRLTGVQEQVFELDNRITLSENKVEFQTREANEIDERVTSARTEIESLSARRAEALAALDAQRVELEQLIEQVSAQEQGVHGKQVAVAEARQMLANGQAELDEARAHLNRAQADLVRAESRAESLERSRDDARVRHERIVADTENINARLQGVREHAQVFDSKLAVLRQTRLALGSQLDELTARRAILEQTVEEGEERVTTLRAELNRRESRLQSLREIHEKYEGFARGTRAVMQASDEFEASGHAIRGLVADVLTAPAHLEIAVEAALGERLGGVLVSSHEAAVRAVRYLEEHTAGRSAFVPYKSRRARTSPSATTPESEPFASADGNAVQLSLGALDARAPSDDAHSADGVLGRMVDLVTFDAGFELVGHALLGDCVVVDGLERAVELHEQGAAHTLVTLQGDIVDWSGVVHGGSRESEGASVLSQKREIRELEQLTETLHRELTDASARLLAAKSESQQVVRTLDAMRKESHEGDIAILAHEKDAAQCHTEIERLRARVAQLNAEQLELQERIAKAAGEVEDNQREHAVARERIEHFEREQLGMIQGVTDGRERVEQLNQQLTEAKILSAQLGEKRASLRASTLQLEATDRELQARIAKLDQSSVEGTARATALRAESAELRETLEVVRTEWREKSELLSKGRSAYELRMADIHIAEVAVRELRSGADKLATLVNDTKLALANTLSSLEVLTETIADRYQLQIGKHVGDYHLRPLITDEDDNRLTELKRLIGRMGSDINLTAIEEFSDVSERHEFLGGQRDDLEQAVEQLEKAIDKINKTSRRLFRDTFNAINGQFQEVFPRLFRGGRAKLRLTAPRGLAEGADFDILDAGVDIMAQPPGKKNSTVEQLSGGEKALTAVALIFSIFLVKPSPFCILDEVDAPLDDVNVDRYNEFVHSMTDRSQFIVITHNKRTMEIADDLYGVTMQEPGVSKLVSVNLSKIDARVAA